MWPIFERFSDQAPTVAFASVLASLLAAGRSWTSSALSPMKLGCFWRLWSAALACLVGGSGGAFAAGMTCEFLPHHPWAIVTWGALGGAAVDIFSANGLERLQHVSLRFLSRLIAIIRPSGDKSEPFLPPPSSEDSSPL